MPDSAAAILWIAFAFAVAGWVKGTVGMGLPTVVMGLLGLVLAPAQAAALLIMPSLITNVWQLAAGPQFLRLTRRMLSMMVGICIGTAFGISLLTSSASKLPSLVLGVVLAGYGIFGLLSPRFTVPVKAEPWLSPLIGLATGVLTGATGVAAIPAVPYLSSLGLEREELIQALGLSFTISTLALAVGLVTAGSFHGDLAWSSLLAAIPALAGMYIGQTARHRLRPDVFRRWFFVAFVITGIYMAVRALAFA